MTLPEQSGDPETVPGVSGPPPGSLPAAAAAGILRGQLAAVRTARHPYPAFPAPVSKRGLAHVCDPVALASYQDAREAAR